MLAVVGLGICLSSLRDARTFLLSGGLGVIALSPLLFRLPAGRVVFSTVSLLLLALYAWAGTEVMRFDITLDGSRVAASANGLTVENEVVAAPGGSVVLSIGAGSASPSLAGGPIDQVSEGISRALTSNLAAGVQDLQVLEPTGRVMAGPSSFWEPDWPGEWPVQVEAEPDQTDDPSGPAGAPSASWSPGVQGDIPVWHLLGGPEWQDLRISMGLRNGGPPVTLLLRMDQRLDGLAVRAWPNARRMSIHQVRAGVVGQELAGGQFTLRKPLLPAVQSVLRELLRAWLVAMAVVALGFLVAPLARLTLGSPDWWAPPGAGIAVATLLALVGLFVTGWVASDVLERIPHVQDSVAYLFQAKTFALGRLNVPVPPVPAAFEHEFILMREGAWFSKYPPGHPLILAFGVLLGAPWLVAPVAAAMTLLLVYLLGRMLYGGATAILGTALLLSSPFFLFMSGSMMVHATSLFLATLGLVLVARSVSSESTWAPLLAGISFGWLMASRQWTGLALTAPVFVWLFLRRVQEGRSFGASGVFVLGLSWPVLALLAYNRALTGNPLLSPFELWWDFDRVGFGANVGMHGGHDLAGGFWNTYVNLTALQAHLFGWPTYLTLAFAMLPFATARATSGDWLLGGACLSLILAYVPYWADGVMFGPRYFYEATSCLALLTARGVVTAAEVTSGVASSLLRRRTPPASAPLFLVLVLSLIAGNLLSYLPTQVEAHRGYNYVSGEKQAIVQASDIHQALVLVPTSQLFAWWDYGSVFSANDPLLEADVIYARDLGPVQNERTIAAFPDRTPYLLANGQLTRISR